jgi:hypothetical protein
MNTNGKKECERRVGLPVTAQTQVNAAARVQINATAQQQPEHVEQPLRLPLLLVLPFLEVNEPGAILRTLLSANAASRGQPPAGTTNSITFEGQVYTRTAVKA